MTNSNDTIKDEFFSDISEADILNEMAEIKSEGLTEAQLLRRCAELLCVNDALTQTCLVHERLLAEVNANYQISEQNWQVKWASREDVLSKKWLALIKQFDHEGNQRKMQYVNEFEELKKLYATNFNDARIKEVSGAFLKKRGKEITVGAFVAGGKTRLSNVGRKAGIASGKSKNNQEAISFIQREWALRSTCFSSKRHFAKTYVPKVKAQYRDKAGHPLVVPVRTIAEKWLLNK